MSGGRLEGGVATDPQRSGELVLGRLRELPGGPQLLAVGAGREDLELIGGATRDLLLAGVPRELDVVVAAGAKLLVQELRSALAEGDGPEPMESGSHERFGTAYLLWSAGRIDIATRRAESYPAPGALPEVREGTPEEDLARRDFTINAIAVGLGGERAGGLRAAPHALEDLAAGRLRVLHERSFIDDPTRLMRLARYLARLGFQPERRTAQLAAEALASGALATVSAPRIGAELRLALGEADPIAALESLGTLGVLSALELPLRLDPQLARAALELLPADGRADLLLLASLLLGEGEGSERRESMLAFLDALEFPAADRDRAISVAVLAPDLARELPRISSPSRLREAIGPAPLEAIALAAALDEMTSPNHSAIAARRWLAELRHVRLRITGDDLLAAGISPGPEIGHRLRAALDMRLDGELEDTPQAQLQAALEAEV